MKKISLILILISFIVVCACDSDNLSGNNEFSNHQQFSNNINFNCVYFDYLDSISVNGLSPEILYFENFLNIESYPLSYVFEIKSLLYFECFGFNFIDLNGLIIKCDKVVYENGKFVFLYEMQKIKVENVNTFKIIN